MQKSLRQQAKELAADIKERITLENLHTLTTDDGRVAGLPAGVLYGWSYLAEERIAQAVEQALVKAEQTTLETVSSETLIRELKGRHDLFFLVATPRTPEEWEWRRSVKGTSYSLSGFVGLHLHAMDAEITLESGMYRIRDTDILSTDDEEEEFGEDEEAEDAYDEHTDTGGEAPPAEELPPPQPE